MTTTDTIILLDTNIVSYVHRGGEMERLYARHLAEKIWTVSFMTVAEILEGAFRAKQNGKPYRNYIDMIAKYTVLPWNVAVCECWARIRADRYRHPIPVADCWIAATAVCYNVPLVTHNPEDFSEIDGLKIITEHR